MAYDSLSVDWQLSMASARRIAGPNKVLAGNVDPMVLYGSHENIQRSVVNCIKQAQGKHVLNLGHGVEKDTKEEAVEAFVLAARQSSLVNV